MLLRPGTGPTELCSDSVPSSSSPGKETSGVGETTEAWLKPPKNCEFGSWKPSLGLAILALAIAYAKTLHAIITAAHFGDHWKVAGSAAANKVEIMDTGSDIPIFVY